MKHLDLVVLGGLILYSIYLLAIPYRSAIRTVSYLSSGVAPNQTSTSTPTPTPIIVPVRLRIPKLKIDAVVEEVGITDTGNMDVPKDAQQVGWYEYGPTPSTRGNAIIAGHFDTPSGRPAIFYFLNKLKAGDSIEVVLSSGTTHEFVVTGKELLPADTFPADYVFATKYGINLNLITCSGVWDPKEKNYDKRLVIYSTKKGSEFNTLQ